MTSEHGTNGRGASGPAALARPPMLTVEDMTPLRWPVTLGSPINRQVDGHVYDERRVLPGAELAFQASRNAWLRQHRAAVESGAEGDPQAWRFHLEEAVSAVLSDENGRPSLATEEVQRLPSAILVAILRYLKWFEPVDVTAGAAEGDVESEDAGADGPPQKGETGATGAGSSPRKTDSPRSAASAPTTSDGA